MNGEASVTFENILRVRKFGSSLLMLHFSLISDFSHDRRIRGHPAIRWWQPGRSSINGAKLWTSWTHRRSKKMCLKFVVHRFDEKNLKFVLKQVWTWRFKIFYENKNNRCRDLSENLYFNKKEGATSVQFHAVLRKHNWTW